jgi:ankyrin repeat protein
MEQQKFLKACRTNDIQTLQSLDYSRINIHAYDEYAFRYACRNGHLDIVKFLLTLEPDHVRIDIHTYDEHAFLYACRNGHLDVVKFLLTLEPYYGRIDIHIMDEEAFRWACYNGHLDIVKFLLTLEPDHGRIDIHACGEWAFLLACQNGHLDVVKYLISLEPDHECIDIHTVDDKAFKNSNFHIKHQLIHRDPNYNWKHVKGYEEYQEELNQTSDSLSLLHQKMTQLETNILELNVIGIVKDYLI